MDINKCPEFYETPQNDNIYYTNNDGDRLYTTED